MKDLSTEFITHKLKIKGHETKYITRKLAENIFTQLADPSKIKVTLVNSDTLTYISKFKEDVELLPLDGEERDIEDVMFRNLLSPRSKESVRKIIEDRKKDGLPITEGVIKNIIEKFQGK